jgi:hypothetical protein
MDVSRAPMDCAAVDEEVWVDPFRCRMWSLHDRMEEYLNEETCRAEIQSFLKNGQLIPVLGRRLRGASSNLPGRPIADTRSGHWAKHARCARCRGSWPAICP